MLSTVDSKTKSQAGFSLVELMVVVAVIGILASISVGQVEKQVAKARQSEAKINLSAIYTAENIFRGEWASFTTDFSALSLAFEGKMRYSIGFLSDSVPALAIGGYAASGGPALGIYNNLGVCPGNCTVIPSNGINPSVPGPTGTMDATHLSAGSNAMIYANAVWAEDQWTINETKTLVNTQPGIF